MSTSAPRRSHAGGWLAPLALAWLLGGTACTLSSEETIVLENVHVDSAVFWPPTLRYAHYGDTLSLHMRGVKRERKCAKILKLGWNFRRDSSGAEYFTPNSEFEIRASCAADPDGLDTMFRAQVFTFVGRKFYLETPDGRLTDSVLFVSSGSLNRPEMDTLLHSSSEGDVSTHGRYVFRDSSTGHPRRTVLTDSLATCETLQTAVFDRRGDTLVIRIRRLRARAISVDLFPACAGPHGDTMEVFQNLYRFP